MEVRRLFLLEDALEFRLFELEEREDELDEFVFFGFLLSFSPKLLRSLMSDSSAFSLELFVGVEKPDELLVKGEREAVDEDVEHSSSSSSSSMSSSSSSSMSSLMSPFKLQSYVSSSLNLTLLSYKKLRNILIVNV
jgi:hypothetical protein